MIRLVMVLLSLGALALFAIQNGSPVLPLVILGGKTVALPLAVWVVMAIAAGALTTALIFLLLRLSRPAPRRTASPRPSSTSSAQPTRPWTAWTTQRDKEPVRASSPRSSSTRSSSKDDWEATGSEDWEDWDNEPSSPSRSEPDLRDRHDDDWARWDGYEESTRDRSTRQSRPDVAPPSESAQPSSASSRTRSPQDEANRGADSVYDAEYRVLIPPYNPEPAMASPSDNDDEDWGLGEEEDGEAPRRSR